MTEARYRGQKVVVVSPDYAGHTKFADHWMNAEPGTDAALALAMAHVIVKEHYLDKQTPYFDAYAKKRTDLPFLVTLRERDGAYVTDRFLRAADLGAALARERRVEDRRARRATRGPSCRTARWASLGRGGERGDGT